MERLGMVNKAVVSLGVLSLTPIIAVASDWSDPNVTDDGAIVYAQTAETRGTGTLLGYACSTESDWCGPSLIIKRPCDPGVVTPALATVTGGAIDEEDQGTFFVELVCLNSNEDGSLLRIQDQDSTVAVNVMLGWRFSIAYPTAGNYDHGYAAERFSLDGSIEAMKSVYDLASAINPMREGGSPTKGEF